MQLKEVDEEWILDAMGKMITMPRMHPDGNVMKAIK